MGLEILFVTQIGVAMLMIIFLQKITQMKKQLDNITKEVQNYIAFLTEDLEENHIEKEENHKKNSNYLKQDASKNHIIQAVLQEYFP